MAITLTATLFLLVLGTTGGQSKCPSGWLWFSDHCYLVSTQRYNWFKAKAHCNSLGAQLATIYTIAENEWVCQQLLALGGSDNFWIGANQLRKKKEWRWVSTGEKVSFADIYPGEPNDVTNSDCMIMWRPYRYTWGDYLCSQNEGFICKI